MKLQFGILFLSIFVFVIATHAQPPWMIVDYDWVDISAIGINTGLTNDDQTAGPFPLGFNFEYFGQTYDHVFVCTNGWLSFTSTSTRFANSCLPDSLEPNASLDLLFDDYLLGTDGRILYRADSANARFIVTYSMPGELFYIMQAIIGADGSVTYNFNHVGDVSSATVGVEDANGSDNSWQTWCNGEGEFQPADQTAIMFWGGPQSRLEGLVRAFGTNQPIEGIRVETAEFPAFTFTDAWGFYDLLLNPGSYTVTYTGRGYCDWIIANVQIEANGTTVQNVNLRSPQVQVSVTSISANTWPGHDMTATFDISNSDGQCPLEYSLSDPVEWLSATPDSGTITPSEFRLITLHFFVQDLVPGFDYQTALTIHHNGLGDSLVIPVTLGISMSANEPAPLPTEFALYQNYPNPFNAVTSIRFDVPKECSVRLALINLMGEVVAVLADKSHPAGRYTIEYDAKSLPSGMYVMALSAGSFTAVRKLLLLK